MLWDMVSYRMEKLLVVENIMARKTKRDDDTSSLTEQDDLQYQMDYDDDGEDDNLVEVYFDEDVYETDL